MTDSYDHSSYNIKCRRCGTENMFYREREHIEKEILNIGDGFVDIEDSDLHPQDEWHYYCDNCGNGADELEDLLEEINEEDEDFPNYF